MRQVDISVCLPTYKRPKMLKQAVDSFLAQDYENSELIVIDDGLDEETRKIMQKLVKKDRRIVFEINKQRIGFSKNLAKTLKRATGKYLYVLGDDDIIINKNTLRRYVEIFDNNKSVGIITSNILQFNNNFNLDFVYKHYPLSRVYKSGKEALSTVWLKSTYIGGLGIRKTKDILDFYPQEDILFPIVEMVGKTLLTKDAYGLAEFAIGMRVHNDQLGFHVMNKKRAVGKEKHGSIELYLIGDRVFEYSKKLRDKVSQKTIQKIVSNFLNVNDKTILITEGIRVSKRALLRNVFDSLKEEKRIKHTSQFWIQLLSVLILPTSMIGFLKETYRSYLRNFYWRTELNFFKDEKKRIFKYV